MSPLNLSSFYICHNAMGEVISIGALIFICDFLIRFEVVSTYGKVTNINEFSYFCQMGFAGGRHLVDIK